MIRRRSACVRGVLGLVLAGLFIFSLLSTNTKTANPRGKQLRGEVVGGGEGEGDGKPGGDSGGGGARVENRFGQVPNYDSHGMGARTVERENTGGDTVNTGGDTVITGGDEALDTAPAGEKKHMESLSGEREHGVPNITNREEEQIQGKSGQEEIIAKIEEANRVQLVYNEELYGPVTNNTVVIAIQVHDRIKYLRQLIQSLSAAKGIENTLLIFSHDVWDDAINTLVRSVDFCMVGQVFYPFSLQTHPNIFPGESRNDCPRDAKKKQGDGLNCINKDWPDLYGHYREAKFTQTKHHWWWKGNHIFGKLNITSQFYGLVLFLEEDHYVAEDFLHVLNLMKMENDKLTYPANILSLGTYLKKFNFKVTAKQVEVTQWVSSTHNMGMALTRVQWNRFTQCSSHFCQYDDYNWDWSLLYVSLNCLREKLYVMMIKGPRVFHIGECGVHHKKSNCESSLVMEKVKVIIKAAQDYLYPSSLTVINSNPRRKVKLKKGNGGWGDKRDHQLCLNMTLPRPHN